MTDFTPTTEQVRDAYVRAMRNAFIASAGEHEAEFGRWLKREQFNVWQNGYGQRVNDERNGIQAGNDWSSHHHASVEAVHTLAAIRAAHTEYEHTHDLHELARAIRNILNGPDGDWLPDNQQTPLPRP